MILSIPYNHDYWVGVNQAIRVCVLHMLRARRAWVFPHNYSFFRVYTISCMMRNYWFLLRFRDEGSRALGH